MKTRSTWLGTSVLIGTVTALVLCCSATRFESVALAKPKPKGKTSAKAGPSGGALPKIVHSPKCTPTEIADCLQRRPGANQGLGYVCDNNGYGYGCVDLLGDGTQCGTSRENAKSCNGLACVMGVCGCPAGKTKCDYTDGTSGCVQTDTDGVNCGGCGTEVPIGKLCRKGKVASCAAGKTACNRTNCTDLRSDVGNCGKCFHECPDGWDCRAGRCVP